VNQMKSILRKVLIGIICLVILWLGIGVALVLSPAPVFSQKAPLLTPAWSRQQAGGTCLDDASTRCFRMRDGAVLTARLFDSDSDLTVIFLHGVLSFSGELEITARMLRQSTGAKVLNFDLRGHGSSAGEPGDINYIGQYEDDLADIVTSIRKKEPRGRIVLAGHSMGGGIVLRYASQRQLPEVDAYLLFAPLLGSESPTTRMEPANGAADASEPTMKIHLPRIIGLLMLNLFEVKIFNDRSTLFFNLPADFPIHEYSFRAMISMSPKDYQASLTADNKPLLVIVGRNDEAFHADRYPPIINLHRNGETVLIEGENHDSVIRSQAAFDAIRSWLLNLQ
jgi:alpha-beta hydrolase superfamily lysophospholipase